MKFWKEPQHQSAFRYARALTAFHSKSFYAATRLLPEEKRWATYALYGFCRHVDNIIDLPRNRSVDELLAETTMLRREINTSYRSGESEHPILKSFILVARQYQIPLEYPLELVKGVEMDLSRNRYRNFNDLYLFAYRVAGVVGIMMTYVLGYSDDSAFQYAENLGVAMQLTNILRDVKEDAKMGRIYLPLEEMARYGTREEDIFQERWSPGMKNFMAFQVERAKFFYRQAQPGIAFLSPKSRYAIATASRIYGGILKKIELNDYNPFQGRVYVSGREKISMLLAEWWRWKNVRNVKKPVEGHFTGKEISDSKVPLTRENRYADVY